MMKRFALLAALVAASAVAFAQSPNPRGKAEAMVGGKQVTIDYGRPALKGRSMTELMSQLPEDRVWRAGENQVTVLDTKTDLMLGGKKIPAGKYSLYVHAPANGDWSLIVNKNLGVPLKQMWAEAPDAMASEPWPELRGYEKIKSDEVARVPLDKTSGENMDMFTMKLTSEKLMMHWADSVFSTSMAAGS